MSLARAKAGSGRQDRRYTLHGIVETITLTEAQFKAASTAVNALKH